MATVYSLICWGGRTGKTVSISASTDVVTLTNHGLRNGAKLWPGGTLPSELNTSTPVYARSTGDNTFTLHSSSAGAIANTGQIAFAGSSTYAAVTLKSDLVAAPSTALSDYGLSDLSRWGASGSERIYDGIAAWNTARASATSMSSEEVCEIGESFIDILPQSGTDGSYNVAITVPCAKTIIWSRINGKRTPAFHFGGLDAGYVTKSNYYGFNLTKYNSMLEGFVISGLYGGIKSIAPGGRAANMIILGRAGGYEGIIVNFVNTVENCLVAGFDAGIYLAAGAYYMTVASCTAVKNVVGIKCQPGYEGQTRGLYFNNISIGNTTNWGPTINFDAALNNAGLSGEAWDTGTSRATVATSHFATWGGASWAYTDDYHPASSSSPQVDTGIQYPDALTVDVSGDERPNYNNGGAVAPDIGCYEFDHGYGPWPVTATLTLTGLVSGSDVVVLVAGTSTILTSVDANAGSSWGYTYSTVQNVDIGIINPGYKVKYIRNYALSASNTSLPIEQQADLSYA